MTRVDFEPLKNGADIKEGHVEPTRGILLNRKDLLSDPGEITIRNKITSEVRQEEIMNYEALRHMQTPQELEEEARIAKILQKSQKQPGSGVMVFDVDCTTGPKVEDPVEKHY